MTKIISLKLSFVVAFALFAIFAVQFTSSSALAQAPEKPTVAAPSQTTLVNQLKF